MGSRVGLGGLTVDLQRIKRDILTLAEIGRNHEDRGIYRMAFTDADMAGRRWLQERIEEAGLGCSLDGVANVCARLPGRDDEQPYVLIGSHIDTVPCAGALDGSLGVVVALECLRVILDQGVQPRQAIELIAFSDEEGRFGGMLGSQALAGEITLETLHVRALDGVTLEEAMRAQQLDPLAALDAHRPLDQITAYLELHIEQGPVLDRAKAQVGIVDEITGLFKWSVSLHGEANHAGTTPMELRNDAFMGLADFAHEIPRVLEENGGPRSRATIGRAQILPGSANTVPGHVEFSLDVRDTDKEILDDLHDAFRRALSAIARRRNLMFDFEVLSKIDPVKCNPDIVRILTEDSAAMDLSSQLMPSGAAHDAQIMGRYVPMGMVFVPSRKGISHSPAEWTDWADIEAGANLVLHSLLRIANNV